MDNKIPEHEFIKKWRHKQIINDGTDIGLLDLPNVPITPPVPTPTPASSYPSMACARIMVTYTNLMQEAVHNYNYDGKDKTDPNGIEEHLRLLKEAMNNALKMNYCEQQ
ncbi:hypothetical protein D3C73_1424690 [compost metagenome]